MSKLIKVEVGSDGYLKEYYDDSIEGLPLQELAQMNTYRRAFKRGRQPTSKSYFDFNFEDTQLLKEVR